MARPPLEIDEEQVLKLAKLGCKISEIADFFGCSRDTIERRFRSEIEQGKAHIKITLRRWQLEAAKKGNVTMLIWLGKNLLEQSDGEASSDDGSQGGVANEKAKDPEFWAQVVKLAREKK